MLMVESAVVSLLNGYVVKKGIFTFIPIDFSSPQSYLGKLLFAEAGRQC